MTYGCHFFKLSVSNASRFVTSKMFLPHPQTIAEPNDTLLMIHGEDCIWQAMSAPRPTSAR
jgi:hypothetical protein